MRHSIPRCKSTQHPDNVRVPFFAKSEVMDGQDEIEEAFYAFSHLGCGEQLWDAEGKETDNYVVKKLLSRYEGFFRDHPLGEECWLSFRVPNPRVEKAEGKILLEALYAIARSYDTAQLFYGKDAPAPIIEVYVPMVQDAQDVLQVERYYDEFIIAAQGKEISPGVSIADWLGPFGPARIRVTPLVEDKDSILRAHEIARELIERRRPEFLRFWLARSDPALNYGNPATVLMLKVALMRLQRLEEETGIPIYPTLGLGSAPFRGNFRPDNAGTILAGYPSVQTFTLQSSFKYDHSLEQVRSAIALIDETSRGPAKEVDESALLPIIEKLSAAYREEVALIAPFVNRISSSVPARRLRKLHVGLFGYAREKGEIVLPRAITFTAACYSIGVPPEMLSLSVLTDDELATMRKAWANFEKDYEEAARYANPGAWKILPPLLRERLERTFARWPCALDDEHKGITDGIVEDLGARSVRSDILRAAAIRRFLG